MKPIFLLPLLCLYSLFSYTQVENKPKDARNQQIEATKLEIEKADSDSLRLKLRVKLAGQLAYFDGAIAKEIYLDVLQTMKDKGYNSYYYKEMEAELLYSMSSVSLNLQDTAAALKYANESIAIATEIGYDMIVGRALSNLGNTYSRQMNFEKANQFHKRSLVFHEKSNSGRGKALTLNRIGLVYSKQEKIDSAIYYLKRAVDADTAKTLKLQIKGNLASIYADAEKYDLAGNIYRENLTLLDPTAYNIRAHNHSNLAKVYDKQKEYNKAYAQGNDIYLALGQEKHLPHEAWHVVQQKQGRVKPTMQFKGKVNVNDDVGLEKEADVMGSKALQMQTNNTTNLSFQKAGNNTIQRVESQNGTFKLQLMFAGSGHNYINKAEKEKHKDDAQSFNRSEGITLQELEFDETEGTQKTNISGPGAPNTTIVPFKSKFLGWKTIGSMFEPLGRNKISALKKYGIKYATRKIEAALINDKTVEVEIIGHSRGAVAGAYVAEALSNTYAKNENVTIKYSGYDPVPNANFLGIKFTKTTDMSKVNRSTAIYSVGSGQQALMKPKGLLNPKVVIITSAQHSANLNGTFELDNKIYDMFNISELPDGVYFEDDWDTTTGEGERGAENAYGKIILKELTNPEYFDNWYTELIGINKAWSDRGRKEEVKKAVDSFFKEE